MTVLKSRKKTVGALGLLAWPMMDQPPEEGKTMSTTCVADLLSAPVTLVVRLVFGGLSRVEFRANWSVCAEYAGMIVAPLMSMERLIVCCMVSERCHPPLAVVSLVSCA